MIYFAYKNEAKYNLCFCAIKYKKHRKKHKIQKYTSSVSDGGSSDGFHLQLLFLRKMVMEKEERARAEKLVHQERSERERVEKKMEEERQVRILFLKKNR